MAKIENYSNDTNITDNDRLFGTSVDGAISTTANFKVSELKTFINTGQATEAYADQAESDARAYTDTRETAITSAYQSYADQAEADAITTANAYTDTRETAITSAYQTYAEQKKQKIVGVTGTISLSAATGRQTIFYRNVTNDDPSTGSLNYNSSIGDISIDTANGEIQNTSGGELVIRISTTTYTAVSGGGQGSRVVSYFLEKYNGSWTPQKAVERTKVDNGSYADSFWSYFKLLNGEKFRIQMQTTHDTVQIDAGSQFEFAVQ